MRSDTRDDFLHFLLGIGIAIAVIVMLAAITFTVHLALELFPWLV
jgi:hypothetical protein